MPKTEDGRLIFAVPWQGRLLVGTTDEEATPQTRMIVLREEAEYFAAINLIFRSRFRQNKLSAGFRGCGRW